MVSCATRYKYSPLQGTKEIRLLSLQPASDDSPIHISIIQTSIGQHPFEALSYTWGDSKRTTRIVCNDEGENLQVTLNCESALRRLRYNDTERLLWIDAICINQEDLDERSRQVQLMSLIYHQATKVQAYIGEPSDSSDVGMDFVLQDAASMMNHMNRPSTGLGLGNTSSPQQVAVDSILQRPYFERVWILQEIEVARKVDVILGDKIVDWKDLSRTVFYLETNKKIHLGSRYSGRPPKVIFYRDTSTVDKPKTLLQFLSDTRHCKASDPRDKIYAVLGMTPEAGEQALTPDYNLSTRDTFAKVTRFFIARDKNLNVLCQVQGTPSIPDMPSWVPDWSSPPRSNTIGLIRDSASPYKASRDLPAQFSFSSDKSILSIKGVKCGMISTFGPVYKMGAESSSDIFRNWDILAAHSNCEDPQQAILETIIASPSYATGDPFLRLFSASWYDANVKQQVFGREKDSEITIFHDRVNKASDGRRLFVTGDGHLGLGPENLQHGDVVAILLGGQVPFILREQRQECSLIGECYVRGYMNGEGVHDITIGLQEFRIR